MLDQTEIVKRILQGKKIPRPIKCLEILPDSEFEREMIKGRFECHFCHSKLAKSGSVHCSLDCKEKHLLKLIDKKENKRIKKLEKRAYARNKPQKIPTEVSFYNSRAWQELRYDAIKKYGRQCSVCNATKVELHVDHIKPRSKFPELELEIDNLQILCRDCNLGKGNSDEIQWRD